MKHEFVEFIPEKISEETIYISLEYNVAKHKCPCGCGDEIVTSLAPNRWSIAYDGETVSFSPSIGNWTHKCKSHYYIRNSKVVWLGNDYSSEEIEKVIQLDNRDLKMKENPKSIIATILSRISDFFRK